MRAKGMFAAFGKTDLDTQRGLAMLLQQGVVNEARDMATEIKNAEGTIAKDLPAAIDNAVDQTARLKAALSGTPPTTSPDRSTQSTTASSISSIPSR